MNETRIRPRNPFICIRHPFDEFYDLRHKGGTSWLYVAVILVVWFLISVMQRQNTGYLFNQNKQSDLNILIIFARTVGLYGIWVAGNWTVSTFTGGIGRIHEIACVSAYSLIPYIGCSLICVILSNALTLGEGVFLAYIAAFGLIWSGALMLIGLRQIHDKEFFETITHMVLTILVMAVTVFLLLLFYTLLKQLFVFIYTIYKELLFRI